MLNITNLKPKQELFLIALVSEPTMDKAIERAGITKKTAYRYLKNKDFSAEYSRLRQEMLKRSTSMLLQASGRAVEVLYEVADNTKASPYARVQACKTAYKGMEIEDLKTRIEALELEINKGY